MSRVKLPAEEQLPFAQFMALTNLDLLDKAKDKTQPAAKGKYNLQKLVSKASDIAFDEDMNVNIQTEIEYWMDKAKKTMDEVDYDFIRWMEEKEYFEF